MHFGASEMLLFAVPPFCIMANLPDTHGGNIVFSAVGSTESVHLRADGGEV